MSGKKEEMYGVFNLCSIIQNFEGQRPMPDSIVTVAKISTIERIQNRNGWKMGFRSSNTNSIPNTKGFDFFYGYNCQRQAHTLYPSHLWRNKERHILDNKIVNKRYQVGLIHTISKKL